MKKTPHYKGHRWTTEELRTLMQMWAQEASMDEIATVLNVTKMAVYKQTLRMRKEGIPLARRKKGHIQGRKCAAWSQGEAEYLIRRRAEHATAEVIAGELDRSVMGVNGMIAKLRKQGVPVAMLGCGVRRLWDAEQLKAMCVKIPESKIIEADFKSQVA